MCKIYSRQLLLLVNVEGEPAMIESSGSTTPYQSISDSLYTTLIAVARSPATWLFAGIWLAALTYLLVTGYEETLTLVLREEAVMLLSLLFIVPLTRNAPPIPILSPHPRPLLWLQIALIGSIILITCFSGLVFHDLISGLHYPLWYVHLFPLINPLLYFVLPMILLYFAGARFREVGFGSGWHSWRVIVLYIGVRCIFGVIGILSFVTSIYQAVFLPVVFTSSILQNGFSEEFLFRGALQTRLRWLLSPSWAVVVSSLVFGLWHIGAVTQGKGGNYLVGAAYSIVSQATLGLFFGLIFLRTRNPLACSVIHAFLDSLNT